MDIICKGLGFQYSKKTEFAKYALKDVSLTIKSGEFFGIIGHTGSGKSTFIRHLNALCEVQEGSLSVGEIDLSPEKKKGKKKKEYKKRLKDLRKSVGMVFQYPEQQLFAETVFEDVAFGYKNFNEKPSAEEVEAAVKGALSLVGLDYNLVKDKSPFDLSGGQKRRVAIAGVLVTKPSILVLDEPCAGLDPAGKTELWALLHHLHKTTVETIIVVSHDMNDVAKHCTRVAMFSDGTLKRVATPSELFDDTILIEESGLEVPVTAFIKNELLKNGLEIKTDYTDDNFVEQIVNLYKSRQV